MGDLRRRDGSLVGRITSSSDPNQGVIRGLSPDEFDSVLQSIKEDYPAPAYQAAMNLVGSHDTQRILWALTPGERNRADREFNAANLAEGKAKKLTVTASNTGNAAMPAATLSATQPWLSSSQSRGDAQGTSGQPAARPPVPPDPTRKANRKPERFPLSNPVLQPVPPQAFLSRLAMERTAGTGCGFSL